MPFADISNKGLESLIVASLEAEAGYVEDLRRSAETLKPPAKSQSGTEHTPRTEDK